MRTILWICVFCFVGWASAADVNFHMEAGGLIFYCGETEYALGDHHYVPTYVTGAMAELVLEVRRKKRNPEEFVYRGEYFSWPQGLEIEIGHWDSLSETCLMDPALPDLLHLQIYHTWVQGARENRWRKTGQEPRGADRNPQIRFTYTLPEAVAGQRLCFWAHWRGTEWGDLNSAPAMSGYNSLKGNEPRPMVISVIAPCSEEDRQQARESYLWEAAQSADNLRTLELADSLIAHGYISFNVINYARRGANGLGQYERAIQLLDSSYRLYGKVQTIPAYGDSLNDTQEYQRIRHMLLEKIKDRE